MHERPRSAMVLAAGLGLRMRPLTEHLPKPLVEVAGRPLIDYTLTLLREAGVENIVVNASYRAAQLEEYLRLQGRTDITLSHEDAPLETGGGIARALPHLGAAPFYAMNSDVILCNGAVRPALERLAEAWDANRMDALLLVVPQERATGFEGPGDFFLEEGMLRRRAEAASAPYIFTGAQILHPRLFNECPAGAFSMNRLYDAQRTADGRLPNVGALVHDGAWLHVGDPAGREMAERALARACAQA